MLPATRVGYERVRGWVKPLLGAAHATTIVVAAWAVLSLLVAPRVAPAALAGSGRSCLRRVRRWWGGPPLDQPLVSPRLIARARALLPPGREVLVALATTRLGPWEVWLAGSAVAGRTLPIGWAVCPYPWPKGRFRATTLALLQRLQAAFPRRCAGGWWPTAAAPARRSSPGCGRAGPPGACGCG